MYRFLKRLYFALLDFHIPAPRSIFYPLYWVAILTRHVMYALWRIFWAEPLFKAVCRSYGKNLRTGPNLHWVQGDGDIELGDNVLIDGVCNFFFASSYKTRPVFRVGNNSGIGNHCSFVVGRAIEIGDNCRLGAEIVMIDSPGHPLNPDRRREGKPADEHEVRPIRIGNNVWIGTRVVIFPGVTIGDNSVVSLGSVVMSDVPPNVLVMGNPARQAKVLDPPAGPAA